MNCFFLIDQGILYAYNLILDKNKTASRLFIFMKYDFIHFLVSTLLRWWWSWFPSEAHLFSIGAW